MIGVGRFIEPCRFHDAVGGEFVDDQVDEPDLLGGEFGAVKIGPERFEGCLAVEADQRADEQSKAVGFLFGLVDRGGVTGAAVDEHLFESLEVIRRECFVAAHSLQAMWSGCCLR